MVSTILKELKMEEVGITQRGVGKNGNPYCPAMGEDFLRFVNDEKTDDKRQSGMFKSELALSKSKFYMKEASWLTSRDLSK
jgi:hypothetical protein